MTINNEWEFFFDRHAPRYMDEPFTKNTLAEVDFILEELELPVGGTIIDIGCGTGRHAVELARRGYKITGIDISKGMLREARLSAENIGVELNLIHADAKDYKTEDEFDAAICICEGAFGLLGAEDDPFQRDLKILRNIHQALKPGGRLIMTALNGMSKIRSATQGTIAKGIFDPLTLIENFELEYEDQGGIKTIAVRERGFVPSELVLMMQVAGYKVERLWGGTAGNWKRGEVDLDEVEIMVIVRKEINTA